MSSMKVLDLCCPQTHVFEGWFASEDDFQSQCGRGLVSCPVCGDAAVTKRPSAPRLNLGAAAVPAEAPPQREVAMGAGGEQALQLAWMAMARRVLQQTDDVGERFAEEARRMHYGETPERGIRGKTTPDQAAALLEEGIPVVPFALPEALKGPLQ